MSSLILNAPPGTLTTAQQVVDTDLEFIGAQAREELAALAGRHLMIAGGAGFLGYYLVQAPLWWNRMHPDSAPIKVTCLDNFIRGVPAWLTALEGDANLRLL